MSAYNKLVERIAEAVEAMPTGGFTPEEGERLRGVLETIPEAARIVRLFKTEGVA